MIRDAARPKTCKITLRAEFLAAAGAASAQHLATTRGCLAGKETVPTGTHEIAGLESPLHDILKFLNGVIFG
jgi:hypothetical protein